MEKRPAQLLVETHSLLKEAKKKYGISMLILIDRAVKQFLKPGGKNDRKLL